MILLQTKQQKQDSKEPERIDILRELHKRQALDRDLKKDYFQSEVACWREQTVDLAIEAFGQEDWAVLHNLQFLHGVEIVTCDTLLITQNGVYTFDTTTRPIGTHPTPRRSSAFIIQSLLDQVPLDLTVQGYFLYSDQPESGPQDPEHASTPCISFQSLPDTIQEIAKTQKSTGDQTVQYAKILELLEQKTFHQIDEPKALSPAILNRIRPGITCFHCASFTVKIQDREVICPCGQHEPLEEAIVRTICEYGLLHHHNDYLDPEEVLNFFDAEISIIELLYCLDKHFIAR